ncbi:uncharacterized protein FTOL_12799 [Fusarium torulosum]|uniref:LITAF domain-containing protein n=1 Tax=Fusarium torulosum TaxID=33205 RepID=A0AAE8MLG3_9HYPO|nr:uncharacterized protein FTOL_12799 [Fusarium torulosum]
MDSKIQQMLLGAPSPLPPPSYSEATITDPLTADGFGVSPMTTTSSPVVFNVSVSPMATTPISSRSMETLTLPHLTDSETNPYHLNTIGSGVARRVDSDCLPQAVIPDGPELALVEYSNNHDNLPIVHTPQTNDSEYFSGLEVVPVQRAVNAVTPLHLLGDQPESIDCPFCLRRSETRVKKKPSSTTQYVITSSTWSHANSEQFASCCAVDDDSLWSSCSLYSTVVFRH